MIAVSKAVTTKDDLTLISQDKQNIMNGKPQTDHTFRAGAYGLQTEEQEWQEYTENSLRRFKK